MSCSQAGIGACKVNVCEPKTGGCIAAPAPAGAPCDDGDACSGPDACNGKGQCVDGPSLCGCKTDADCVIFDDGDACNGGQVCKSGACAPTAAPICDDGNDCTTDACDASGGCNNTPVELNTPCKDDGKACTQDACFKAQGCVFSPLTGAACEDGDACTVGDACTSGVCKPGAAKDCSDGNVCTTDACDSASGSCSFLKAKDGASCVDVFFGSGMHWTVTPRAGSADKAWAPQLAIGYSTTDDAVNQASVRCVHDP